MSRVRGRFVGPSSFSSAPGPWGGSASRILGGGNASADLELKEIELHGHCVAYRSAGSGPVIVLVHGITSTSETWERVMPTLAKRFTVIAPDLLGHGGSAKPRGDYSLGAYASGVRDLLIALGHERATFVGHSLGGGVAMQLAYQFPERCERLVLIDSGGLGSEVNLLLRMATLPGAEFVLPFLASEPLLGVGRGVGRFFDRLGLHFHTDIAEMARGHSSLSDSDARAAFVHTLRTIVDPIGQRVSANDRLYLAEETPFLIYLGQARQHHSGRACVFRARARADEPVGGLREGGPLPARRRAASLHRGADGVHRLDQGREDRRRSAGGSCCRRASRRGGR